MLIPEGKRTKNLVFFHKPDNVSDEYHCQEASDVPLTNSSRGNQDAKCGVSKHCSFSVCVSLFPSIVLCSFLPKCGHVVKDYFKILNSGKANVYSVVFVQVYNVVEGD